MSERASFRPMRNREEITREVESRNGFRAEVGLPSVSVPKEVEKIYKAELYQDFLVIGAEPIPCGLGLPRKSCRHSARRGPIRPGSREDI